MCLQRCCTNLLFCKIWDESNEVDQHYWVRFIFLNLMKMYFHAYIILSLCALADNSLRKSLVPIDIFKKIFAMFVYNNFIYIEVALH